MATTITNDDLWESCPQCSGQKTDPRIAPGTMIGGQCTHCEGLGVVPTETAKTIVRLMKTAQQYGKLFMDTM